MHRLQVRQQGCNLRQKRVGEDSRDFLVAHAAGIADKLADVYVQSLRQPFQRTQSRNRLAVFNFGDIGPGHQHPASQLPLAQMARFADIAHLPRHLQPGFSRRRSRGMGHQLQNRMRRLLDIEGPVAFSAKGVGGSVLDQAAEIAAHNLARLHAH